MIQAYHELLKLKTGDILIAQDYIGRLFGSVDHSSFSALGCCSMPRSSWKYACCSLSCVRSSNKQSEILEQQRRRLEEAMVNEVSHFL